MTWIFPAMIDRSSIDIAILFLRMSLYIQHMYLYSFKSAEGVVSKDGGNV